MLVAHPAEAISCKDTACKGLRFGHVSPVTIYSWQYCLHQIWGDCMASSLMREYMPNRDQLSEQQYHRVAEATLDSLLEDLEVTMV